MWYTKKISVFTGHFMALLSITLSKLIQYKYIYSYT